MACGVVCMAFVTVVNIVLTTVVVMVPGTKSTNPFSTQDQPAETGILQQELSGWVFAQATDNWVTDNYPRSMGILTGKGNPLFDVSTAIGNANLDTLISANIASGVVCFGYSQGATVQSLWLNDHANGKDLSAPSADKLSFVMIGNPNRPNGGALARIPGIYIPVLGVTFSGAMSGSQYKTTDVMRQYDIFGDFPVDPLNVFSLLNVLAGAGAIHGNYLDVNVNDPSNWIEVDGNMTYIMAPAKTLPLADALRSFAAILGRSETPVIDAMEPVLKYFVELGYDRTNQGTPTTFQPGSSINRFFNTLPRFVDAIMQGETILQSGLHPSTVQPPANSQTEMPRQTPDTVASKPEDNPSDNSLVSARSVGHLNPRVLSVRSERSSMKSDNNWRPSDGSKRAQGRIGHEGSSTFRSKPGASAIDKHHSPARRGSTGHSVRRSRA